MKNFYKKNEELINYLIVGGLTTVVGLGTYYLAVITVLSPQNPLELQIANIFSWICAVSFAYFTNRKFVFKSKNEDKLKEATKFVSSRIFSLILDMLMMYILVTALHIDDKIAKLAVQVIITITNYILSKLIVFKKS